MRKKPRRRSRSARPGELFAAFYKEMTGADLTAAQEAALADSLQAAQAAGEEGSAPGNKEETL